MPGDHLNGKELQDGIKNLLFENRFKRGIDDNSSNGKRCWIGRDQRLYVLLSEHLRRFAERWGTVCF